MEFRIALEYRGLTFAGCLYSLIATYIQSPYTRHLLPSHGQFLKAQPILSILHKPQNALKPEQFVAQCYILIAEHGFQ